MTKLTKSGLYVRRDQSLRLLAYSPFTGLMFACMEETSACDQLLEWLDCDIKSPPDDCYLYSLGPGWATGKAKARFPRTHLLSSSGLVPRSHKPESLLVVNWLISAQCLCRCRYCYSSDIMDQYSSQPNAHDVRAIARQILSYQPLAVVLTGGDPLMDNKLEEAIEVLHGHTGIVIDTNGARLTKNVVKVFSKHNVFVRVSMDSELPRVNDQLRPMPTGSSLQAALEAINLCLDNDVGVGVQTVVTKKNMSDLEALGHKLYRMGVTSWRLQVLVNHSLFSDYKAFEPNLRRFRNSICSVLGQKNRNGWDERMSIQPVDTAPNAVVLVAPDGRFLTELNGKVPLCEDKPFRPSMDEILRGPLDLDAHATRYLNISG